MKRATATWFTCALIVFILLGLISLQAQERVLEPTEGFVNEIIKADTLSDGGQAHTIYIFRRGETYYFNGYINNVGYPITLKAEDGTGRLPMICNYPDGTAALNRFLLSGNDAYIYNLYIDGMGLNTTTFEPDPTYTMNGQLLNAAASGNELIVDGCVLNNAGQVLIRSNSGARKVEITNTVLANSGQMSADNIGNGRIIDFRNGATDTVIFKNCTMVNTLDRIIRHYGAAANATTAFIQYMELDHNTIVHNTGAFGYIMLGDIAQACRITNNLLYNPVTLGNAEKDTARLPEVTILSQPDVNGKIVIPLIIDQPNTNSNPSFTISNNVVVYDAAVKQFFSDNGLTASPVLTPRIAEKVSGTPYTDADVILTNIPATMTNIMNWYQALAVQTTGGGMITTSEVDMDRHSGIYWIDSLDCSYTTDDQAFIGSDGEPVGSGRWNSRVTGVDDATVIPDAFSLSSNYPNPFNPSTRINFSLPVKSNVSVVIFNTLGQAVKTLLSQELEAGNHSVTFNAEGLSSGVYIYKLNAVGTNGKNFSSSHKMTLLK
jgi:hypothetical protein